MIKTGKIIRYGVLFIGIIAFSTITLINRDEPANKASQPQVLSNLDQLQLTYVEDSLESLEAGWARRNITPDYITSMAGYRRRPAYENVHDSLYVRTFVIKKGNLKVAMISIDLLIFPPSITRALEVEIEKIGWQEDQLYLSATHTHNGIGGWLEGIAGYFSMGAYNTETVNFIATNIAQSIREAEADLQVAQMGYLVIDAHEFVYNRVNKGGAVDGRLHVVKFVKNNGESAVLTTYNAHPTCIDSHDLTISNDYPYYLMGNLEKDNRIGFSAFFAGSMGSHGPMGVISKEDKFKKPEMIGKGLAFKILNHYDSIPVSANTSLLSGELSFPFDDLHIRISDNFRTRKGLFNLIMGSVDPEINILKLGNVLFLSAPCDTSGELNKNFEEKMPEGQNLVITNFNGTYMGYVTPDIYYDSLSSHEIRDSNWIGPKSGSYFTELYGMVIDKVYR